MRAARMQRYGDPDVFAIDEIERPIPGPRDVLIEVYASSVNPVDTKLRSGAQRMLVHYRLPWVLGLDVSGVVVEVGERVTKFAVGDEVYASPRHSRPGCAAELVAVDEREVARKPERLDHLEAASIPLVGLTAWDCLVEVTRVKAGERVLIHAGAGGVGSFAIQLAKHLGAEVATTCSDRNVELMEKLGADHVVNYKKERFEDVLEPQHVVLESLGPDSLARSLTALRRGGRLVSIQPGLPARTERYGQLFGTLMTGLAMAWLPLHAWLRYGVRARNLLVREPSGEHLGKIAELIDQGAIVPVIDSVFPLDDIADAHRRIETGHARGKVVVAVKAQAREARP